MLSAVDAMTRCWGCPHKRDTDRCHLIFSLSSRPDFGTIKRAPVITSVERCPLVEDLPELTENLAAPVVEPDLAELPEYALSIRPPWPYAIFQLGKDYENRTWSTNIRGRVMVHASVRFDLPGYNYLIERYRLPVPPATEHVAGAIVGDVQITDCVRLGGRYVQPDGTIEKVAGAYLTSPWACGPYCFKIENPRVYGEPLPCVGRLGFFRPQPRLRGATK